jgi:hypothetical protein
MAKPQNIATADFRGKHNSDLGKSIARVKQGGTWKKQRCVVVIPSADLIPAKVALSHWSLIFPPNQSVYRHLALGQEVGDAYSHAITEVLANPELSQWEYLLTIEHDNLPPGDGVLKLIEDLEQHPEFAAVCGLYWCKGPGGCAHIWGDVSDPVLNYRPQAPIPNALQECMGLSMGFTLWRLKTFKDERLKKPWFKTIAGKDGVGTQDLAFWSDARKYGYRCAVDTRVLVGHYDYDGKFSGEPDSIW